ncbi:MAG: metallophosphoesterase [Cyclobacteriaceae bacterium]|nr:MAG: metallophosphoesterase [Cyclobacteriaceae bacterium]
MYKLMTLFILLGVLALVDFYVYQAVLTVSKDWTSGWKAFARYGFWVFTAITFIAILWYAYGDPYKYGSQLRNMVLTGIFMVYFSKLFGVLFLLMDDIQRGIRWATAFFQRGAETNSTGETIPRSEFLAKAAVITATIPFAAMTYGIISGAHDYRIRRRTIYLPNLPKSFDGIRIGQLSDIHSGSFFSKTAVQGGVEMFLKEKPDLIFFTGDLVNNQTSEVKDYVPVFSKLKAPLGIYSVTGNHDYGDYVSWSSPGAKQKNFRDLMDAHKEMGFDLLMNENRLLEQNGDKLAILGIENWGAGRFAKYGKLDQAHAKTDEAAVKLLLSHDPSHWDAQVRSNYDDIDVMFAGHTHGFQFGVEIGGFKWSPSQYVYKQWAGLYQEDNQYLYVNRGFGYIGYPGRVGIPPELTIIELKRA